jgi:glycosyltransferase involved in cell wall biosynthesis
MRNRFFTQYAGVDTTILTFDSTPMYPRAREVLTERGELIPGMQLLNIYEYYRQVLLPEPPLTHDQIPALEDLVATDVIHPDGGVYYTSYHAADSDRALIRDYRRPDGSIFLRTPADDVTGRTQSFVLVNRENQATHSWPTRVGWSHHWLHLLLGPRERAFIISDGNFSTEAILPLDDPRFYHLHLIHNAHVGGRRLWSSGVKAAYRFQLDHIREMDGLVALSQRQKSDLVQRFGERDNMFVVPNPVVSPPRPEPLPTRESAHFAIMARLTPQKRLDEAVRVFALVVAQRPWAKLTIYGYGPLRSALDKLIAELGLTESVEMRGWDPHARDALWTATGFLMTSWFEGYPLSTLESMSHGCPVVSYDIKYGPREQISDGVDGFLIPNGDREAMADRIVEMIDDARLVQQLSTGALAKALQHDPKTFMRDWERVLTCAEANRPHRVVLSAVRYQVHTLGYVPTSLPRRLVARLGLRTGSASLGHTREMRFEATARVAGVWNRGVVKSATWTLDAISSDSETVIPLRLRVHREGRKFSLSSSFDIADVFENRSDDDQWVSLRLRLVLHNECWETIVKRATPGESQFEVTYASDGRLHLHRGRSTDDQNAVGELSR